LAHFSSPYGAFLGVKAKSGTPCTHLRFMQLISKPCIRHETHPRPLVQYP